MSKFRSAPMKDGIRYDSRGEPISVTSRNEAFDPIDAAHARGYREGHRKAKADCAAERDPLLRALRALLAGGDVQGGGFAGTDYTTGRRKFALFPDESDVEQARALIEQYGRGEK